MKAPLLCRMGYHKFSVWSPIELSTSSAQSLKSPRGQTYQKRRCQRCGLEHTDYSPQEGMQFAPPESGA